MRTILGLVFVLILTLTLSAHAAFEGRFRGTGSSLFHKSGNKRACSEIFLSFRKDENKLKLMEGGYRCEELEASFPAFTLEIRDGIVFNEGLNVGTYSEDRLEIFYTSIEENFTYHWLLEFTGDEMSYLEEWTEAGKPALTVSGVLKGIR